VLGRDDEVHELAEHGAGAAAAHLGLDGGDELARVLEPSRALLGLVARGREGLQHAEELRADGPGLLGELLGLDVLGHLLAEVGREEGHAALGQAVRLGASTASHFSSGEWMNVATARDAR